MKKFFSIFCLGILLFVTCCLSSSQKSSVSEPMNSFSKRDSVLIYKVEGMKLFMGFSLDLLGGGDDTQYWAFGQADSLLNAVDYQSYEESLARYYSAVSYINNGLSYIPTIMKLSSNEGKPIEGFPPIGLSESVDLIIENPNLSGSDRLKELSALECKALYSMLYNAKVRDVEFLVSYVSSNFEDVKYYEQFYSSYSSENAYKLSSMRAMQLWFIFLNVYPIQTYTMFDAAMKSEKKGELFRTFYKQQISENKFKDLSMSRDELSSKIDEIALWHDSLDQIARDGIENLSDEQFQEIELKAARYHFYMLKIAAEVIEFFNIFMETYEESELTAETPNE